mgnify:CR=1 FL=1
MGFFGLMSRKKHEAALQEEKAAFGQIELDWRVTREDAFTRHSLALAKKEDDLKARTEALLAAQASAKEAWSRTQVMGVEKDDAVARMAAAEAECARIAACHVGRVRIFVMPIDALEMTARARAVEGSVRVQWSADEKALVGDAGGPLTDAQYNAVVAAIAPQFNRT